MIIIEARDYISLEKNIGNKITIIGKIENCRKGMTKKLEPYVFLDFGDYGDEKNPQTARLVIWNKILKTDFMSNNIDPKIFVDEWVEVTGLLETSMGKIQIVIKNNKQIKITRKNKDVNIIREKVIIPDYANLDLGNNQIYEFKPEETSW